MRTEKLCASQPSWQDAFIAQAQNALITAPDSAFYLAALDSDDIPELIINYGSVAAGEEIFAWSSGQIVSLMYEYYAFNYIPGTGMIRIGGGRMGGYYDEIRQYDGTQFGLIATGQYVMNGSTQEL
ncbi:MAG: hypothetical protein IJ239_01885, partial [Eubacterium sp.]|nr:hypothetical protein [Eubacterium sp.]